jgi:hypothetical protein
VLPVARINQQPSSKPPRGEGRSRTGRAPAHTLADPSQPARARDQGQPPDPRTERQHPDAPEAEEQHDGERGAEDGARRAEGGGCEREHRDGIDQAEREEGQGDRLQTDRHAGEATERRDLDDVIEPERQDGSAGGRRAARREAATPIRPGGGRKQPLPAERSEDETREVRRAGGEGKLDLRARERPARARDPPRDEHGCGHA